MLVDLLLPIPSIVRRTLALAPQAAAALPVFSISRRARIGPTCCVSERASQYRAAGELISGAKILQDGVSGPAVAALSGKMIRDAVAPMGFIKLR